MDAYSAVKQAAAKSGVTLSQIGVAIGNSANFVSNSAQRGGSPRCDTMARMLAVCGYSLVAVPSPDVPPSALAIDAQPVQGTAGGE